MSELTPCNYCTLRRLKRENKGKKVELRDDDGWKRVFIDDKDGGHLFWAIGDHCEC